MVTIFPGIIFVGFLFGYIFLPLVAPLPYALTTTTTATTSIQCYASYANRVHGRIFLLRVPYFSLDSNDYMRPCVYVWQTGNVASQTLSSTEKAIKMICYIASPVHQTSCCIATVYVCVLARLSINVCQRLKTALCIWCKSSLAIRQHLDCSRLLHFENGAMCINISHRGYFFRQQGKFKSYTRIVEKLKRTAYTHTHR